MVGTDRRANDFLLHSFADHAGEMVDWKELQDDEFGMERRKNHLFMSFKSHVK